MKNLILLSCLFLTIGCESSGSNSYVGVYNTYFPKQIELKALELQYDASLMGGGKLSLNEDSTFSLAYPPLSYSGTWRVTGDSLYLQSSQIEYRQQGRTRSSVEPKKMIAYGVDGDLLARIIAKPEKRSLEILSKED